MNRRTWLVAAALSACHLSGWGQIFVGADASGAGAIVLSNFRTDQASVLLVGDVADPMPQALANAPKSTAGRTSARVPPIELQRLVASVAKRVDLAPELLHAVILAESRYDPTAVSSKGAIGLMQVLPSTGRRFGAENLYSTEQNVTAGASYLKWLLDLFDEDLALALAAYNAGEQAVIRAGRKIPRYPETQAYVRAVMANLKRPISGAH
jgi:soluble lytic murein transglycosylase-like protein